MPTKSKSIKATTLAVAIIFTLSVSGYFMGLRQTVRETGQNTSPLTPHQDPNHAPGNVQATVDYNHIAEAGFGPNAQFKSRLSTLKPVPGEAGQPHPRLASEQSLRTQRESRRAYDGAPPIVPHPIAQDSAASCLQCHRQATRIGDVVASASPHPEYTRCSQCHVSSKGLGSRWNSSKDDLHSGNQFQGNHRPKPTEQAYEHSPKTIPHTLHMRQNCISCHGELGTSPIRTSHPERQSCTQCHVPGSQIDKRNFAESPFPLLEQALPNK